MGGAAPIICCFIMTPLLLRESLPDTITHLFASSTHPPTPDVAEAWNPWAGPRYAEQGPSFSTAWMHSSDTVWSAKGTGKYGTLLCDQTCAFEE